MDNDKDGLINEEEWLTNLQKLPGVRMAIEAVLDADTGRVKTYRSLPEQLAKLMFEASGLELRCWAGEDVSEELAEKRTAMQKLRNKGVKPSPGLLVFQQIDLDGSGTIDRKELQRLLKALPKTKPAPGVEFVPFDDMVEKLDGDKDGLISEEEWLTNLQKLPGVEHLLEPASVQH